MTKGQAYSALAGLYRQFELYYVVGDERDIVRLRTNFRFEDVYLYRLIAATSEKARALVLDYVKSTNELHERPHCEENRQGEIVRSPEMLRNTITKIRELQCTQLTKLCGTALYKNGIVLQWRTALAQTSLPNRRGVPISFGGFRS
jgi:Domain of unknown function (DUF4105)